MKQKKIFIGIPSRDPLEQSLVGKLSDQLLRFSHQSEFALRITRLGGYPVDRVRNQLAAAFLASDCDFLLMIDDDIVPPDNVLEMARYDKDIVAALCYAWNNSLGVFAVAFDKDAEGPGGYRRKGIKASIENSGLLAANLVGTGCMMIARRVLTQLQAPYFKTVMDPELRHVLDSEDFYFCKRAEEEGFQVFLDSDKVCSHYKSLDLRDVARWARKERKPASASKAKPAKHSKESRLSPDDL